MTATRTARPVNGTGYTTGKSPRDYLRQRAAREIRRLHRAGK